MPASSHEVTQLLVDWGNGNQAALDKLMPLVYEQLHRLAHQYLKKERTGHTLQTSALVNEAFVKLIDQRNVRWQNRAQFYGIAAQLMRRILVDYARRRHSQKCGGDAHRVELEDAMILTTERAAEVIALDDALKELAEIDARKSQIVELRFFGGLTIEEAAEVLEVSPATIMRDWTLTKAWLQRAMIKSASKPG